jgi:DNA polymerase IIIc chi subunit
MTGDASGSELWALRQELATVRDSIRKRTLKQRIVMAEAEPDESDPDESTSISGDYLTEVAAPPWKSGPRIVASREKEQAATQLASTLMEALADYFVGAERQAQSQAEIVGTSLSQELEKQRDSIESLIELLAERLGQQAETLSSVRRVLDGMGDRLDRQADAIRSLSELQVQHAMALKLLLEALGGSSVSADAAGPPPDSRS